MMITNAERTSKPLLDPEKKILKEHAIKIKLKRYTLNLEVSNESKNIRLIIERKTGRIAKL